MRAATPSPVEASRILADLDPTFRRLVADHGPPRFGRSPRVDERFEALARSIAYQQLAGRAASAIWARARALVDGPFTAPAVLELPEPAWRSAGLSGSKTAAIVDLARHVVDGRVDLAAAGRRNDERIIAELVAVRGIGRWTAQMFLLSALRRPDVWPVTDYGVRLGYAWAHGLDDLPEPRVLDAAGDRLRPVRSVAAWYCWREVEARRAQGG